MTTLTFVDSFVTALDDLTSRRPDKWSARFCATTITFLTFQVWTEVNALTEKSGSWTQWLSMHIFSESPRLKWRELLSQVRSLSWRVEVESYSFSDCQRGSKHEQADHSLVAKCCKYYQIFLNSKGQTVLSFRRDMSRGDLWSRYSLLWQLDELDTETYWDIQYKIVQDSTSTISTEIFSESKVKSWQFLTSCFVQAGWEQYRERRMVWICLNALTFFAVLGYGIPKDEEEARKKLFMPFQARVTDWQNDFTLGIIWIH